jgi:hypothetical protein
MALLGATMTAGCRVVADGLRRLGRAFRRLDAHVQANPYCPVCEGYHPSDAVRFSGQRLCHALAGQPLPLLGARQYVNEDWIYPGDPHHSGVSRESIVWGVEWRKRGRDL